MDKNKEYYIVRGERGCTLYDGSFRAIRGGPYDFVMSEIPLDHSFRIVTNDFIQAHSLVATQDDLACPANLTERGLLAHRVIVEFLREGELTHTGGCKAFFDPHEWIYVRHESYGHNACLIIVHDGGDLADVCNIERTCYDLHEEFRKMLDDHDLYIEQCTSWYSAVYSTSHVLPSVTR